MLIQIWHKQLRETPEFHWSTHKIIPAQCPEGIEFFGANGREIHVGSLVTIDGMDIAECGYGIVRYIDDFDVSDGDYGPIGVNPRIRVEWLDGTGTDYFGTYPQNPGPYADDFEVDDIIAVSDIVRDYNHVR